MAHRFEPGEIEEIVRQIGPVVDAHQHFWDLEKNPYPWLQDKPIEVHFGDYQPICKTYLPGDLHRDARIVDILGSVHVEAHWRDFVESQGETAWLSTLQKDTQLPSRIVGYADPMAQNLADVLDDHSQFERFTGVRTMTTRQNGLSGASLLEHPKFRRGVAQIGARGLTFDLQAFPQMMAAAVDLVRSCPGVSFILLHAGLPKDRSEEGLLLWRKGIAAMAKQNNVVVKLSGLPMTDQKWSVASLQPFVMHLLETFGPDRMMFGSNFPVDGMYSDYPNLVAGYAKALGTTDARVLGNIFRENAARIYRLKLPN